MPALIKLWSMSSYGVSLLPLAARYQKCFTCSRLMKNSMQYIQCNCIILLPFTLFHWTSFRRRGPSRSSKAGATKPTSSSSPATWGRWDLRSPGMAWPHGPAPFSKALHVPFLSVYIYLTGGVFVCFFANSIRYHSMISGSAWRRTP